MSKQLELTKGQFAIVDDADYDFLSQWKWYALERTNAPGTYYAARRLKVAGMNSVTIYMHRQITGAPDGKVLTDHINRQTLDNRRANLRCCGPSQNSVNAYKDRRRQNAPYRGITRSGPNSWVAQARWDGKLHRFGTRRTAEEAARLYDQEARKLQGEFAILNFPEQA